MPLFTLIVGNIKVFCESCDARETFAPIQLSEMTDSVRKRCHSEPARWGQEPPPNLQLYSLTYQCQRCERFFSSFLVRREDWRLILEGRSPLEHIEVANFLPRAERDYFRDALIAIHAGKTLAALFYLRTFIEQFARRQTGKAGRATGDEIMEAYNDLIPLLNAT
ncbi:MAG TPA: hypothetical protein VIY49_20035 [Bryobacteraceae bacterium]